MRSILYRGEVRTSELTEIIGHAEHLLWVIARLDVESVVAPRTSALRRLRELEAHALQLGIADLYGEVLAVQSRL